MKCLKENKIEEWEKDFDDIEGISDSVKMFFKPRIRRWIKLERLLVLGEMKLEKVFPPNDFKVSTDSKYSTGYNKGFNRAVTDQDKKIEKLKNETNQ